jgi:hypothetical protein
MKNRPERKISFLVVWLTMFSFISGNGQILLKKTDMSPDFKHLWLPGTRDIFRVTNAAGHVLPGYPDPSASVIAAKTQNSKQGFVIRPDIYYYQSGFFCKREWELEKATHIPFRFRLGSLADLDAMEGKH